MTTICRTIAKPPYEFEASVNKRTVGPRHMTARRGYPRWYWQITAAFAVIALGVAFTMASAANSIVHAEVLADEPFYVAKVFIVWFMLVLVALELPHQLIRLIIWLGRMSGNALRHYRG